MNRIRGPMSCHLLVAALVAVELVGCQKAGPATPPTPPTPQSSFKLIVEDFRRNIETTTPGVVARQSNGATTAVTINNIVTDKLLPPANDGEPFRAEITVTTRSRVSRTPATTEGKTKRDDSGDDSEATGTSVLEPDADILDPALVSSSSGTRASRRGGRGAVDLPIVRPADEDVQTYELVFRNNRWDLITEVNLKTDSAVKAAFDHALKTQM